MSIHLSRREIRQGYKGIKQLAQEYFQKGNTWQSLVQIKRCSVLAQQFNWIYADDELEDLLQGIGDRVIPEKVDVFAPLPGRVVFYDDFCTSFVLALQYMRALVIQKKEILYITSKNVSQKTKFDTIIDEVRSYPGVTVKYLDESKAFDRIRGLYKLITDFRPEKLLLHMKAFSYLLPAFYVLPPGIDRYIINLADQTFWLGKKAIDYSLEFRPFGASVSLQRRGLDSSRLLMVPFYPITDKNAFAGFPPACMEDRVIVFSGGDMYKVCDCKRTYWNLVKMLLNRHPEVVFMFATKVNPHGESDIKHFIDENGFSDRLFFIGFRKDISEVFRHCDIYMGTCPASGSLMSQLAAINAKPILQYYVPGTPDDETEQAICFNDRFPISFSRAEDFLEEADHLIRDAAYRVSQGERLSRAMIRPEQFDRVLADTLETNRSQVPFQTFDVNYQLLDKRWYELEVLGQTDTLSFLYGIFKKEKCLRRVPSLLLKKKLSNLLSRLK